MNVTIFQGHSHDLPPSNITIVIDVIRAFTVAHYAFHRGAKEIVLAGTADEAFLLKKENPDYLLAGEIGGLAIPGFDFDNSPKRMAEADVEGRTLVQKTTNGVKATLNALGAEAMFVTGFSNAKKTAEAARKLCGPGATVTIIASHPEGDDDLACAEYIKAMIVGDKSVDNSEVVERIRGCRQAEKFFDPNQPEFIKEDISFCTNMLDCDFVMYVDCSKKLPRLVRVNEHELHWIGPARP
ncbi:2-phosphosulfolactate phosphatase [Bacillus sp. FJAT-18017]|uniref:2-phosphosulfolactate phosphatase n=1 Tax=Bacillus sp. FJAT-18017 TaxID=1705566 RepID=UPI0006AF96DB|nr:2-phosphosulfolactate phosphatase [Bacillus sp. FJAT-18017]ALC88964.1 2-phosphosulfolactate phosphatase [Bacillus sp. FJAT-18017]